MDDFDNDVGSAGSIVTCMYHDEGITPSFLNDNNDGI